MNASKSLLSLVLSFVGAVGLSAFGDLREQLMSGKMGAFDEIVFAVRDLREEPHWYANIGYYDRSDEVSAAASNGRLAKYNFKTGTYTLLLDDPAGSVRDPSVHYDGKTILFSYRPGGTDHCSFGDRSSTDATSRPAIGRPMRAGAEGVRS